MSPLKAHLTLFIAVFSLFCLSAKKADEGDLDRFYRMGQFSRIVAILENREVHSLPSQDKWFYIECLARSTQRYAAEKLLRENMTGQDSSCQALTTAGIVRTACGQFLKAKDLFAQALELDPECPKAWMAKMMLELYLQNYDEAREIHERIKKKNAEWAESYLFHLSGIEIYGAEGDLSKIAGLYKLQADKLKKIDKKQYRNYRNNFRLFRNGSEKKAFQILTTANRVALPFIEKSSKDSYAVIPLRIYDREFKVLLDTGNRAGWTIHSPELKKRLKQRTGAAVLTQIGAEEEMLHGSLLLTKRLEFRDFTLNRLPGMYIPKPNRDYPDANMNPLFIKDRVISLDFRHKELILRTEERFWQDLERVSGHSDKAVKLPWYGYEQAFIPVAVNSTHEALAMIETGAEDVTVNLDFARSHGLDLKPAIRYLSTGKEFPYHNTSSLISIGQFRLRRQAADVWFFNRAADVITGLMPDVLLGPKLFEGKFVLTFDPFQKIILISDFSF
jgi:tetratricopeptide (TPR) repeat protein